MTGLFGTAQLAALAATAFAVMGAAALLAVYPIARPHLLSTPPAARARILTRWLATPSILAVLLTGLCFVPSALSMLGIGADHCPIHDDHHAHLCLVHLPRSAGSMIGWFVLALAGGVALTSLSRRLLELWHARTLLGALATGSAWDVGRDVRCIESPLPLSVASGINGGTVLLSSRLAERLSPQTLEVVIEHERAHLRRRDTRRRALTHLLSVFHFPPLRTRLQADLVLACEQACDEEAAERVGDRLRVASAIVAVERIFAAHPPSLPVLAPAFRDSDVTARVEHLLRDAAAPRRRWLWTAVRVLAGAAVLAAAGPLHHTTETALSFLTR